MVIQTLNIFCCKHEEILMKVSEVSVAVAGLAAQLVKIEGEILGKINALELALSDADLTDEAVEAFNALRANVQALDDIVPDEVVEPEVVE
jgi:hypothetical protein